MPVNQELARYVDQHFVVCDRFLQSAGIDGGFFHDLVEARAVPGPIYRLWDNGSFWSPIGGQVGIVSDGEPGTDWYSPAAIWWARRARVLAYSNSVSIKQIAARFRADFCADFIQMVLNLEGSRYGYPDLLTGDTVEENRGTAVGIAEWNDWIDGGYGVCLRRFDARHLVTKTSESARVRHITDEGRREELSPQETMDLLDALDRLDAVMLPFAPHQRPFGTPGKWVDAVLKRYRLGSIPLVEHRSALDRMPGVERHCG